MEARMDKTKAILKNAKVIASMTVYINLVYASEKILEFYAANALAFEINADSLNIEGIFSEVKPKICKFGAIGVNNILTKEQVIMAAKAGSDFCSSYINPYPEFAEDCHQHGMVCIIGGTTVPEINAAYNSNADFVLVYPSSLLGIDEFIRVNKESPPKTLIAGEVDSSRILSYLNSGAFLVTSGGSFVGEDILFDKTSFEFSKAKMHYIQKIKEPSFGILDIILEKRKEESHIYEAPTPMRRKANVRPRDKEAFTLGDDPSEWVTTTGRATNATLREDQQKFTRMPPGGYSQIKFG